MGGLNKISSLVARMIFSKQIGNRSVWEVWEAGMCFPLWNDDHILTFRGTYRDDQDAFLILGVQLSSVIFRIPWGSLAWPPMPGEAGRADLLRLHCPLCAWQIWLPLHSLLDRSSHKVSLLSFLPWFILTDSSNHNLNNPPHRSHSHLSGQVADEAPLSQL